MELTKVKGIVTRSIDWRESDKLITLVTLEYGRMTATVRGCKKSGAKLRYAAEPLNFGEYMLSGKDGKYIVADCVQIEAFLPLTQDIDKYYSASMMLELMTKLTADSPSPNILIATIKLLGEMSFDALESVTASKRFLTTCLSENGSGLNFEICPVCGSIFDDGAYFSESLGLVCPHCANRFTDVKVEQQLLDALRDDEADVPSATKKRANKFLAYAIEKMLGAKTNPIYFGEID